MKIDLLYFDGCPSWHNALANLENVLDEEGLAIPVNLVEVKTDQESSATKFLGSPSIQFNEQDLWPEERSSYLMNCRVYKTADGLKGWPTVDLLREKIHELIKDKDTLK